MFEIIQWDGKPISKPGLYAGIPLEKYHGADITVGPNISSTGLRTIINKTPAHYFSTSHYNPDRVAPASSDAFNFGRAAHFLMSSESGFRQHFSVRPDQWDSWRTKDSQTWRKDIEASGKTVVTPDDIDTIKRMAASLVAAPEIKAGLLDGIAEASLFMKDERTGVWLKSRPDVVPNTSGMLADLKTTEDASYKAVQRSVAEFGYHIQAAIAIRCMKAILDIEITDFVLVFLEKKPPYVVNVIQLDGQWIEYGMKQARKALDTFAQCWNEKSWPGYPANMIASMPDWAKRAYENEEKYNNLSEEL